jgi:hypothetical protein
MSFPAALYEAFIQDLGSLIRLRDQALDHAEIAHSPETAVAIRALADAVKAVGDAVVAGDSEREIRAAQDTLALARRQFEGLRRLLLARGRAALVRLTDAN